MRRKFFTLFLIVPLFHLVFPLVSHAGFGITPPYVSNTSLTRSSVYEQTILIVRSDPTTDLKAKISMDIPDAVGWFEVLEGREFLLPAGEKKVPMTVRVTVPDDAKFESYKGNIRVRTGPADDQPTAAGVSIALGAQIDVDITVIDKKIKNFKVRKIGISDLNEGHKVAWLYFPGKIKFEMLIENLGNVAIAPSSVVFRLYDPTGQVLLEEAEHKGKIDEVDPFETDTVFAEIPTRLPAGSYIGRFEILNGEDVKHSGELNVSILPYGTLQAAGFGFSGLSLPHKLSVIMPVLALIVIILLFVIRIAAARQEQRSPEKRRRVRKVSDE